jgi:hypothetical protein
VLLFIVLFFVYPLKFVFTNVVKLFTGQRSTFFDMSPADNRLLLSVYSVGFVGIMLVFVMLYNNVYRKRAQLGLTAEESFDAHAGARTHAISMCLGLVSIVLAWTLPLDWFWLAGPVYALQGPLHWRNGVLIAQARARAFPSSKPVRQ